MCATFCPTGAIFKFHTKKGSIGVKHRPRQCVACGTCADICPKKAITLTDDYMMTATDKADLIVTGKVIKKAPPKPKFTPEQLAAMKAAAEAKKKAAEAAQAAAEAK